MTLPISSDKPACGHRPNTKAVSFNFDEEINHLPFKLNLGQDTKMTCVQVGQSIGIIYDHPEVFSLHDEDLRFCKQVKHTIPMTSDRPVYLPHHTVPPQLQGEVHKCSDTWS